MTTTTTETQPANPTTDEEREQQWRELLDKLPLERQRDAYPLFVGYVMNEVSDEVFAEALAMVDRTLTELAAAAEKRRLSTSPLTPDL